MNTLNTSAPTTTPPRDVQTRRRWLRALLVGILVLIIAILAGGTAWSHHLTTQAQDAFTVASQAEKTALADLADTTAQAATLLKDSKDKTSEEQTRADLATSLKEAESLDPASTLNASEATRSELDEATQAAAIRTQEASDLTKTITTQMQAVKDSITRKDLTDAKDALTQQVALVQGSADAARAAIDSSSGKVADDQVRVDAETARTNGLARVEEAKKLLTGDDLKALQAMANTLAEVNSDIATKTKAVTDAQGAWQQAQDAAAAAQAPAQTQSSTTTGSSTYSDQTSSSGSGGSWTPAPSGTGGGGGNGSTGGNGFSQTVTDSDGHVHHQITPDPDGSYTDDLGDF